MVNDPLEPLAGGNENLPLVKASELAEYDFCARAWWLGRVKKIKPAVQPRLAQGQAAHTRHGRQVEVMARWRAVGLGLIGVGALALVGAACLAVM